MPLTSTYFKGREAYDKGAIAELRAALYFIERGYNVYWPAARNGPVDFIVENPEGGLRRCQVKTATWVHSSNICLRGSRPNRKAEAWDEWKAT